MKLITTVFWESVCFCSSEHIADHKILVQESGCSKCPLMYTFIHSLKKSPAWNSAPAKKCLCFMQCG